MINNEDLKVIENVIEYLSMLKSTKATEFSNELVNIYNKVIDYKKNLSNKVNDYNKKNKKYHNLTNALYYNRKRGNQAKVREIEIKLNELKNSTN